MKFSEFLTSGTDYAVSVVTYSNGVHSVPLTFMDVTTGSPQCQICREFYRGAEMALCQNCTPADTILYLTLSNALINF